MDLLDKYFWVFFGFVHFVHHVCTYIVCSTMDLKKKTIMCFLWPIPTLYFISLFFSPEVAEISCLLVQMEGTLNVYKSDHAPGNSRTPAPSQNNRRMNHTKTLNKKILDKKGELNIYFLISADSDITAAHILWAYLKEGAAHHRHFTKYSGYHSAASVNTFSFQWYTDPNFQWDYQSLLNFQHLLDWKAFLGI